MEGNKLEISNKITKDSPTATYKQIPEFDQEEVVERPKKLTKEKSSSDGAEEKMLPEGADNVTATAVKFTSNEKQNGDTKLDIGELKSHYVGMGKEELMKYANDPFWVRLRWFLFIGFWVLWAAMLVGAVMIIVAAPKCSPPEPRTWWEQGPLAELKEEITKEELEQIKNNGIQGVILSWLSVFDAYALQNESYLDIVNAATESNINVIVDLNPITSDKWFGDSEGKDDFYGDYYIWKPPSGFNESGTPIPPNNWVSKENRSSWIYSNVRKEFYYSPGRLPHLNFYNPNVVNEFTKVLLDLLSIGVKGVRLHGVSNLLVDKTFADETISSRKGFLHTDYEFYTHTQTENLADIGVVLKQWRDIVKNKTGNGPFLLAEDLNTLEPYKVNRTLVIDLPRHSKLFNSSRKLSSSLLYNDLKSTFTLLEHNWPLWEKNNDALPSDVLDIVITLLPGVYLLHNNESIDPELLKIRSSSSIMYGSFLKYEVNNKTVFSYIRVSPGNPGYLVAVNPTDKRVVVDFSKEIPGISSEITVQFKSKNYNETNINTGLKVDSHAVPMSAESAGVFTYVPKSD